MKTLRTALLYAILLMLVGGTSGACNDATGPEKGCKVGTCCNNQKPSVCTPCCIPGSP